MRKSIAFFSAALTAFVIAMLSGVVYAYKDLSGLNVFAQQPTSTSQPPVSLALAAPTTVQNVSPQSASQIASQFLNRTDLYSIEMSSFNGTQAYKVTFSSGDVVYVGLDGQVLSSAQPTAAPSVWNGGSHKRGNASSQSAPSQPPSEHEGGGDGGGGGGDGGGGDH